MKQLISVLFIFGLFVLAWQQVVQHGLVSELLLPSPFIVGEYLYYALTDGTLMSALSVTLIRLCIGYSLGIGLGILLGLFISSNQLAHSTLGFVALGLQTLPSVCWAPLALLWFGQTESAMYFVVVMGSMWAMMIATEQGVRSVPSLYIKAAQVMGSKKWHTYFTVTIPASLPFILNGAKMGWAFAWRSLMAAEIYISIMSNIGIGQLLHFGRELNAMDQALGIMLVIITVGLIVDRIIFFPLEKYLKKMLGL